MSIDALQLDCRAPVTLHGSFDEARARHARMG